MHGNVQSPRAMPRNPIAPSLARTVEASAMKPAALYEHLKMNAGPTADEQRFKVPSSKRQIKDLQKNFRQREGRTDIESILLRLSKEYNNFHLYVASPRVVLVLAEPLMIDYCRNILQSVSWSAGIHKEIDTYIYLRPMHE